VRGDWAASVQQQAMPAEQLFELFTLYEEAARATKTTAWTQTTWILTLSAGVLGFSVDQQVEGNAQSASADPLALVVLACALATILALFLFWALNDLGHHIANYWSIADGIKKSLPSLDALVALPEKRSTPSVADRLRGALGGMDKSTKQRRDPRTLPHFVVRLHVLNVLFLATHIGWLIYVGLLAR
jgi:hypothetical protein